MSRSCRENTIFSDAAYDMLWAQIEKAQAKARRSRKQRIRRKAQTRATDGTTDDVPYNSNMPSGLHVPCQRQQAGCEQQHVQPAPPYSTHTPRTLGNQAETLALQHLQQAGMVLLARNLQCRSGEIDLIMRDGQELVFVEVRQRTQPSHGGAAASVDTRKQRRLVLTAAFFLPKLTRAYFHGSTPLSRFDVVAIEKGQLLWLRNAFMGSG